VANLETRLKLLELRRKVKPAWINEERCEAIGKYLRGEGPEPPASKGGPTVELLSTEELKAAIRQPAEPSLKALERPVGEDFPGMDSAPAIFVEEVEELKVEPVKARRERPKRGRFQGYRPDETYQRSIDELGLSE